MSPSDSLLHYAIAGSLPSNELKDQRWLYRLALGQPHQEDFIERMKRHPDLLAFSLDLSAWSAGRRDLIQARSSTPSNKLTTLPKVNPKQITDYQPKYFAYELTKHSPSDSVEKLAGAVASAQVALNPYRSMQLFSPSIAALERRLVSGRDPHM